MKFLLSEGFYWLFNMSISASIVGCIILLIGKMKNIPRRIICILWSIPFFRMWIPIGMNSKYSLMTFISNFIAKTIVVYDGVMDFSTANYIGAADTYFPIRYKIDLLEKVFQVAGMVWIMMVIGLLLALFVVYGKTKAELQEAKHLQDNLYLSNRVTSPAIYGIVRPKIVIPQMNETIDLKFIILHENSHIKRKDNLWRVLGIITACIHWFNPLSWLFLKTFLTNLELACDEDVLSQCSETEKKEYATTLLNCVESKSLITSAFGGAKVRTRIKHILSYRKLSMFSMVCFIILAGLIGYILLTNAYA